MLQLSLKQLTLRYTVIMLSLVIALSIISFISIKNLLDDNYQEKQLETLKIKAYNISVRLEFYRRILYRLAEENKTKDLIVFGDKNQAQLWAKEMQLLLPDSISVALFNDDGEILGQQKALRVGRLCYADLHRHINDTPFNKPPVHREDPAFAHFDLFNNVISNNENIGVLFASFRLSVLQALLGELTEQGQHLQLYTGDNKLIVETNHFVNHSSNNNILHTVNLPIKNSDWYLKAHIQQKKVTDILVYIGFTNAILFILLSFMLFVFSNRLVKTFSSDFKTIKNLLIGLKNNDIDTDNIHSKLSETEDIIIDIQHIAEDISESQQQLMKFSQCDDLTGLLNRRGFLQESTHCIDLAKRSIESTLILLDLDYFKQVNDNFGHATGDLILKTLASCIKSSTRTVDVSARIGGDEFSIILVKCSYEQAITWYQDISEDFQQQQKQKLNLPDEIRLCSLSAGYAGIEFDDKDISYAMSRADKALYAAKGAGRSNIQGYEIE
ncbi:MAG: hypothetical protein DIZ80_15480 [endosymbiont of Galathealinum brachiosum]|uniref:diguanylate cyclase n=1 Tax=endosymbiont of Galathealinum brachiosum TaxID=2200906 RepID=A0A370DA69_9GAMM|nr:MAG: hypothetical protein DIZ80_15480 [endosymbiont of Galathealinum brachiosum]